MQQKTITITNVRVVRDGWSLCEAEDSSHIRETYAGKIVNPVEGVQLDVTGEYITHPKYGQQFKVESSKLSEKQSEHGLINYLGKADIRGVGIRLVTRIVNAFKDDTINVIRNDWMRLTEVKGISEKKAQLIHDGEMKRAPLLELLAFDGITYRRAELIFEKYKEKAVDIVKNNTYQLIYDIDGIGFMTADHIALANGADPMSKERVGAAIVHCLRKAAENGHCYETKDDIRSGLATVKITPSIPEDMVEDELSELVANKHIILCDEDKYYLPSLYKAETEVAFGIAYLANKYIAPFDHDIIDETIEEIEYVESERLGIDFRYEKDQLTAIRTGLNNRISVITGGAGTGKTTIIKTIMTVFEKRYGEEYCVLCAPTGKASKRMTEATGFEASTIHRLLLTERCRNGSLIVCDETSMIDIPLAAMLVKFAVEHDARIVFVGDVNQLPPIGPGMFFRDMLECEYIPTVKLTACHRQAGNIALNADMVNKGYNAKSLIYDNETTKMISATRDQAPDFIISEYKRLIQKYGVENVCVISPMKKANRSPTASTATNPKLRALVNPNKPEPGCKFAAGDRVMNLKNDKAEEIYNGDVGIVRMCSSEQNEFDVEIDGVTHFFPLSRQEDFDFAYAMTVHKAQGSEYSAIIFVINSDSCFMMNRNLIYTAITRAKKEIVTIGETNALQSSIRRVDAKKRRTMMLARIESALKSFI